MMKWGAEEWLFVIVAVIFIAVMVFVWVQSGKVNDCAKRGGYAVDTSRGWVCAKLEKV